MANVSIIIPLADDDRLTYSLSKFLLDLDLSYFEVILSVGHHHETAVLSNHHQLESHGFRLVRGKMGRARQMNRGVSAATGTYIWFLHGDSKVPNCVPQLKDLVIEGREALFYFDLKFDRQFTSLMSVNELGVWIRSRILKIPFGDQGFFIRKSLFEKLGQYDEEVAYGEDHLLVWACHKSEIPVLPVGSFITTSSRKYQTRGWLPTTLNHLRLTAKQAGPELVEVLKKQFRFRKSL